MQFDFLSSIFYPNMAMTQGTIANSSNQEKIIFAPP